MRDVMERIYRRVLLMVAVGRITAPADDAGNRQAVQVRLSPDEVRDATPMVHQFGYSSSPPVGSSAVTLFIGGDRSKGLVIGTLDAGSRFRGLKQGESTLYNGHAMFIHLAADGIVIEAGGMPVTFKNASKARFEMPVESTGEIKAHCDDAFVTLSGHRHPGTPPPVAGT